MQKNSLILLLFISILLACERDGAYHNKVSGRLFNANNEWIVLYEISADKLLAKDSVQMDDNGNFSLNVSTHIRPQLFMLKVKDYPGRINLLLKHDEDAHITGDALYLDKTYRVSGSPGSEEIRELNHRLNLFIKEGDSLYVAYRSANTDLNFDSLQRLTDSLLLSLYQEVHRYTVDYCLRHKNSLTAISGLYSMFGREPILNIDEDFPVFKEVSEALQSQWTDNPHTLALARRVQAKQQEIDTRNEIENSLREGKAAPNLILPDPEGKQHELAAMKGKYVLLYFWQSTSKKSWDANALIKKYYPQWHQQNIELMAISTDIDKLQWVNTIALDKLPGLQLIADERTKTVYNLKQNGRWFLINPEGIIIARDFDLNTLPTLLKSKS